MMVRLLVPEQQVRVLSQATMAALGVVAAALLLLRGGQPRRLHLQLLTQRQLAPLWYRHQLRSRLAFQPFRCITLQSGS